MMFKFKCFITIVAFKFAKFFAFVVANHVPLQAVHVLEALMADLASLLTKYHIINYETFLFNITIKNKVIKRFI